MDITHKMVSIKQVKLIQNNVFADFCWTLECSIIVGVIGFDPESCQGHTSLI